MSDTTTTTTTPKTRTIAVTLQSLRRNISSTGKSGHTDYVFVALPEDDGFTPWRRPQDIPSAIMTRQASFGHRAYDRHSATEVELELPIGALAKTVRQDLQHNSSTSIERLTADGTWEWVRHVGNKRGADSSWITVVEIDGRRVQVHSAL